MQIGRHVILELWECDAQAINSQGVITLALEDVVMAVGATLLDIRTYGFPGQGFTGVAILTESHAMIHTWPEHRYAAVDVFTCGQHTDPLKALEVLKAAFKPEHVQYQAMDRGIA